MTLETKKLMTIITSMAILMLIPSAMAQTPGEDEFGDIGPTGITNELEQAKAALVEIMQGTSDEESLLNVFDNARINLMGISPMPNDPSGVDALWVGIDEEVFFDEISNVKEVLTQRYPNIEMYIFAMSELEWASSHTSITVTQNPNTIIPDNTRTQSVSSSATITQNVVIGEISVTVDITHTWIGDLTVSLVAPNGETIVLHSRSGGSEDNISQTYVTELAGFIGQNSEGIWELKVGDYAGGDIGTLNSWSLTITPDTLSNK